MDSAARPFLKYAIASGICLLVAAAYFFANIPLPEITMVTTVELMMVLCDAFFIPGVLCLMVGLLLWVASEGGLDGIGYLGSYLAKTLIPGKRATIERYGDYIERKRANRKKGTGFLCVVGFVFIVVALIFYGLYYVYY